MTYQEVYLMDNLTIEAKAIYGMLCSYAGTGAEAFPSVDFMCDKLKISNTRFYKHMNLLIGAGVVKKVQTKSERGVFVSNTYILTPNLQNSYPQNRGMENPHLQNEGMGNEGDNNNNYNNTNYNNNNFNNINVCPEPEKAPDKSGILLPLNNGTAYDVPLSKIDEWKAAFPAVDVEQELRKMITWLNSNPERKKTSRGVNRFINNWLSKEQDKGGRFRTGSSARATEPAKLPEFYEELYKNLGKTPPSPDDPFQ